jgi:mannose-6-phosphate isomerase-like protein (cupin superfamily)
MRSIPGDPNIRLTTFEPGIISAQVAERKQRRPRVVHIDDVEPIAGPATLTWRPVRATLGVRAFGTNAYTADEPGVDVVEPHTESLELAHEELYFVHRGRATFTIDGEQIDAPAGTYVFVPDPASHRHAVAAEAGTTVLSFGGPATFEPSAWEWTFRATAARKAGDLEHARAVLEEALGSFPDSAAVHYELACFEATSGHRDAALARLGEAIARNPEVATWARDDEDFASLRDDSEFAELIRR